MNGTERARELFEQAYERQMAGDLLGAIDLYTQSLEVEPTAEAYTFRGWTYSFMGQIDRAIEDCRQAIQVDPDFGNPYNDIGAYLIQLGRLEEAVPWLEKAIAARRYEDRQFAWANLARVAEARGRWSEALRLYRRALELRPDYLPALVGAKRMLALLN